jgi:hypothetical protein
MKLASISRLLLCLKLSLLLISCSSVPPMSSGSASAHVSPTGSRDLHRFVLVVQEAPDGRVTHSWQAATTFDISELLPMAMRSHGWRGEAPSTNGRIMLTAGNRDCEEERDTCEDNCMSSDLGPDWDHIRSRGAKHKECRKRCMKPYIDCCRLRELEEHKFQAIDTAVDWLKRHRRELLVGTSIVISGVAFVVVVTGTGGGVLVLAPALLLVSSDVPSSSQAAAVTPW